MNLLVQLTDDTQPGYRCYLVEKNWSSAEMVGKIKQLSIPKPRRLVLSVVVLGIVVLISLAGLLTSSIWFGNYSKWKAMADESHP